MTLLLSTEIFKILRLFKELVMNLLASTKVYRTKSKPIFCVCI